MKTYVLLTFIVLVTISCNNEKVQHSLIGIGFMDLQFRKENDKCGEWGGDERIINISRERNGEKLFAEYIVLEMNCDSVPADKTLKKSKKIKLNDSDIDLVYECIDELLIHRLENENMFVSNAANVNLVRMGDIRFPDLLIVDRNGERWDNFERLVEKVDK